MNRTGFEWVTIVVGDPPEAKLGKVEATLGDWLAWQLVSLATV